MTLYARSDMISVSIPATSGGCGHSHSRPVKSGAPVRTWGLNCPPCEAYLRGDRKQKIIKVIPGDKEAGIPSRMEHVADSDPHWSNTPEGIPPTPDEQHINKIRAEKGAQELQYLTSLSQLKAMGINIPDNAMWLLEKTFDPRVIRGSTICPNGHDNSSGVKFCNECGTSMDPQKALEPAEEAYMPPVIPLTSLHVATLRKMCREKGVSDKGKKEELIARL